MDLKNGMIGTKKSRNIYILRFLNILFSQKHRIVKIVKIVIVKIVKRYTLLKHFRISFVEIESRKQSPRTGTRTRRFSNFNEESQNFLPTKCDNSKTVCSYGKKKKKGRTEYNYLFFQHRVTLTLLFQLTRNTLTVLYTI